MNKNNFSDKPVVAVTLGILLAASIANAAGLGNKEQYALEINMTSNEGEMAGQSMTMKYYVGEDRLRTDMSIPGMGVAGGSISEFDGDQVTTYILIPQMKQYMMQVTTYEEYLEESDGPAFGLPDDVDHPCQADPDTTCEKIGTDTLIGRSVVKYRVTDVEDGIRTESTYWFDPELMFPLKVESDDGLMEVVSVDLGAQPDSLFEVPAGWTEMKTGY